MVGFGVFRGVDGRERCGVTASATLEVGITTTATFLGRPRFFCAGAGAGFAGGFGGVC